MKLPSFTLSLLLLASSVGAQTRGGSFGLSAWGNGSSSSTRSERTSSTPFQSSPGRSYGGFPAARSGGSLVPLNGGDTTPNRARRDTAYSNRSPSNSFPSTSLPSPFEDDDDSSSRFSKGGELPPMEDLGIAGAETECTLASLGVMALLVGGMWWSRRQNRRTRNDFYDRTRKFW